jgi:G:T-mismatch repair DNA endonuclease (very short patch repair protein)
MNPSSPTGPPLRQAGLRIETAFLKGCFFYHGKAVTATFITGIRKNFFMKGIGRNGSGSAKE